ncbi:MAG: chloride channel protein [Candidatus Hodarchaeales archaeon]
MKYFRRYGKTAPYRFQRDLRLNIFAIMIGFVGGIAGILFRKSVEFLDEFIFGADGLIVVSRELFGPLIGSILTIIVPSIGGLIVGFFIYKYFPLSKGHGIPNVLEAMHLHENIKPKTPIGKFILSIVTIGTGLSAGSEGPIAQIGAGAGSFFGERYCMSPAESNILIAAGAGAGIAAVFKAPLGGTMFALEILLATLTLHTAVPIAIACIVAVTLNFIVLGDLASVFAVPAYELDNVWEYPYILILGLLIGLIAVIWQKSLGATETYCDNNRFILPINTAIGGAIVGVILVIFSNDLRGGGYPIIHEALGNSFTELTSFTGILLGLFLILTCFLKIAATSLSLGTGVSGGIFAPSLFMGATFGAGYAVILNSVLNLNLNVGLYALLGLASLFAAAARAPITMLVITIEMSGDLRIVPAMMPVVLLAFIVHLILVEESIYTEKIAHKGISSTARTVDELMNFITLEEVMTKDVIAILEDTLTTDLLDIFMCYKHQGYPVVDREGNLKGMVTMFDLRRVRAQRLSIGDMKVTEIMTKKKDLILAYPSMTVKEATDLMHQNVIGRLPVVLKSGKDLKLIGIFSRSNVIQTIESFQGFLDADRRRIKRDYEKTVENLMVDVIPASYHHLSNKVVVVSRDTFGEAAEYLKKRQTDPKKKKTTKRS